jgi:hypothetical protein
MCDDFNDPQHMEAFGEAASAAANTAIRQWTEEQRARSNTSWIALEIQEQRRLVEEKEAAAAQFNRANAGRIEAASGLPRLRAPASTSASSIISGELNLQQLDSHVYAWDQQSLRRETVSYYNRHALVTYFLKGQE